MSLLSLSCYFCFCYSLHTTVIMFFFLYSLSISFYIYTYTLYFAFLTNIQCPLALYLYIRAQDKVNENKVRYNKAKHINCVFYIYLSYRVKLYTGLSFPNFYHQNKIRKYYYVPRCLDGDVRFRKQVRVLFSFEFISKAHDRVMK